ncbi:Type II/IV secretion system ATP hydrolase TadA/VirB11/CpaF, TadA subfamily [Candidatus Syntrophocurvum alkaliphilum]|uniref:Type II/IV secretion system ATP hydrolase TadA/VirB11/CpaF, TadA subfamily n=1 Tax=Candidatus Syntrophocurvum alkaliphilum TaxID=2293317 RepID=A0A6I6DJM6_9FIRM|nr:CpaF family protein [Candidatus Syntrophocurvum alkaliphilum]QGU00293.1 Type II/IV secretion system ATP hydrolase TadA/VirB11/CpaF, TadA subfamily [Candidatus Syntrophocurvum alkaliphilum]
MSLLQKRLNQQRSNLQDDNQVNELGPLVSVKRENWTLAKEKIIGKLADSVMDEFWEENDDQEKEKYISQQVRKLAQDILKEMNYTLNPSENQRLITEVVSDIIGFGPITPLLGDNSVNEIMVNGAMDVYVERSGKVELTDIKFKDNQHIMHIIERIVSPLGRRIDESSPMVDARLPDGSRINAIIPPLALNGPVLTIRKFSNRPFMIADLINHSTLSQDMGFFLKACMEGELNTIVAGGTASGKTTTLNVLSSLIPSSERIITIEDAAELQLQQKHLIRLESRTANIEGKGTVTIRDLVINSLRMRPDRLVVGEVRGSEALDMLQAMNTGHDGCLTTAHANSARDVLSRLETMVLMAGVELPIKAIREQIMSALDLIVFQSRLKDGSRKITSITEVVGMEGDVITLQDIFLYEPSGINEKGKIIGSFRTTGVIPKFLSKLEARGVHIPLSIFNREGRNN